MIIRILMVAVAMLSASLVCADTEVVGGITWTYKVVGGEASVGGGTLSSPAVPKTTAGSITIPSTLGGYPVTSIGVSAFHSCGGLTDVTIQPGVTIIGMGAFYGCNSLTTVTLPSSVASIEHEAFSGNGGLRKMIVDADSPYYTSVNGMLLTKDGTELVVGVNGDVTIPSSVTSIGGSAFCGCTNLTSVTIPSSVTNIGAIAFYRCTALKSVTIPSSVTSIGETAFWSCSGLTSVSIPSSVTSIGSYAFQYCSGLTSVTIPSSVTRIGSYAFQYCSGLGNGIVVADGCVLCVNGNYPSDLEIPEGTRLIADSAFRGCGSLMSVKIPSSVTSIGSYAFSSCGAIRSATIPSSVKRLCDIFPSAYNSITNVVICAGETSVMDKMFCGCGGLESVTIPEGVTSIGSEAFYGCNGLMSVTLPSSVASIGAKAFSGNSGLVEILVDADSSFYTSVNGMLLTKDGTSLVVGVNGDVTIPSGVTSIGGWAFYECSRLTSVTIPTGVTSIGDSAFANCDGLASVAIPASVKSIGYATFYHCDALASVTVPSGVTSIGGWAFGSCGSLTSVTLPSSVTSIGAYAYLYCGNIRSATVPTGQCTLSYMFPSAYASITNVVISEGTTSIRDSAFAGCGALESVTIPSSVLSIGASAFLDCSALATVFVGPRHIDHVKGLMEASGANVTSLTFVEMWNRELSVSPDSLPGGVTGVVYSCALSAGGGTAPYSWKIIRTAQEGEYVESRAASTFPTGGTAKGWKDDNQCWTYTLPFAFPFYGKKHSTAYVSSNGTLAFDGMFSGAGESEAELKKHAMIAVLWDDLRTTYGNIYVKEGTDSVTFRWKGGYLSTSGKPVNFAVTLHSDGRIRLSYGTGNEYGGLVGISAGDGVDYQICSCSQKGSLAYAQDVVLETRLPEVCGGIVLSNDGVLSGTPSEVSSNLVHVMVTDAQGKMNHREFLLQIDDKFPDGVYSQVVDGVEWHYAISDGLATVGASASEGAVAKSTAGALAVPVMLGNRLVTGIGAGAFHDCANLESVVIPSGVTSIGDHAFDGCGSLTNIVFAENAPTAGSGAFVGVASGCTATVYAGKTGWDDDGDGMWQGLTLLWVPLPDGGPYEETVDGLVWTFTIADGEALVGGGTEDSTAVAKTTAGDVTIPPTLGGVPVTSIGAHAFDGCEGVVSVTIPSSVTSIGVSAFKDCVGLGAGVVMDKGKTCVLTVNGSCPGAVDIPDGTRLIADGAFADCGELTNVVFSGNAPTVGSRGFEGVTSGCTATVRDGTTGWDDDGDGMWQGLKLVWLPSGPYSETVDGTTWTYVLLKGRATVTGCSSESDDITIPPTLGDCPVTSIGPSAFSGCGGLTGVAIPSSVTSIGDAFADCGGLKSVTIPACVTQLSSTFPSAYANITNVVVSEGVTSIGTSMFDGCSRLETVTLPSSVTSISRGSGFGSSRLKSINVDRDNPNFTAENGMVLTKDGSTLIWGVGGDVTIPSGVTCIGDNAFCGCGGLKSVTIPASVTNIGASAFTACGGLKSVTIPACVAVLRNTFPSAYDSITNVVVCEGVTSSATSLFYNCRRLESVSIPSSMTNISSYAFSGCGGLMAIQVAEGNSNYKSVGGLLLTKDGATLLAGVNGDVTIPSGVTSIGEGAFYKHSGLTSVEIPSGVTSIGDKAFYGCSWLTNMTIPSGVTTIGASAFYECGGLTLVTLPSSVTSIGAYAFKRCGGLGSGVVMDKDKTCVLTVNEPYDRVVVIPDGTRLIAGGAFSDCGELTSVTIPASVTCIGDQAFFDCVELVAVTIPSSVKSIGGWAFWHCVNLGSVTIQPGVESIGSGAFMICTNLTAMTLPSSVTNIGDQAFSGCSGLESMTIPSGVKCIEFSTFSECTALKSLEIPSSVTNVDRSAFNNCTALRSMTIPACAVKPHMSVFSDARQLIENVVVCEGATAIGMNAFYNCWRMKSVTLPSTVRSIDSSAFGKCEQLNSLTFLGNAPTIGARAFSDVAYGRPSGCTATVRYGTTGWDDDGDGKWQGMPLRYIETVNDIAWIFTLSDGEATIVDYMGPELEGDVLVPAMLGGCRVTSIGDSLFADCWDMTSVTLPSSLTNIGNQAFHNCIGLEKMVFFGNAPTVEASDLGLNRCTIMPYEGSTGWDDDDDGMWKWQYLSYADRPTDGTYEETPDGNAWKYSVSGGQATAERCLVRVGAIFIPSELGGYPVTGVGASAFSGCTGLKSVTLPPSVTSLGASAFYGCSGMTNITFGGNAPEVGAAALDSVNSDCTATVYERTKGWGDSGSWNGMTLVWRSKDPIPALGKNPTREQIADALYGSADPKLAECITSETQYAAYRAWAMMVTNAYGYAMGAQAVKDGPNAWLSFALGCDTLIAEPPTEGAKIEAFESAEDGVFEFTVSVEGIKVGKEAAAENLKKVFGLEGGASLDAMSANGVDIEFGTPEDGKVKFSAKPKDENASTYFMRVNMKK